jgi:hypothetical protein
MNTAQNEVFGQPFDSLPLEDEMALMLIGNKGIQVPSFLSFAAKSPLRLEEWAAFLNTTPSHLQHCQDSTFDPILSDRIIEISLFIKRGVKVFGNEEKFKIWLNSKIPVLEGKSPKELLNSTFGIRLLMDELGRIEHGVLA